MSLKHLLDRQVEFSSIGSSKTKCLLETREDASLPLVRGNAFFIFLIIINYCYY